MRSPIYASFYKKFVFVIFTVISVQCVQAHSIWLDEIGGKVAARFGDSFKEIEESPGLLDMVAGIKGWKTGDELEELQTEKKKDHILFLKLDSSNGMFGELVLGVNPSRKSARKTVFYARWVPCGEEIKPVTALDIIPEGEKGKFRIYFRGKPLSKAKVSVMADAGLKVNLISDQDGAIHFKPEAIGLYVLTCRYSEPVSGKHEGHDYESVSHIATLSWKKKLVWFQ